MTLTAFWLQAATGDTPPSYTSLLDRNVFDAIWGSSDGALQPGDLKVTSRAAGANMSVDVAAGKYVVDCSLSATGGKYLVYNTATVNVVVPAAPASGSRNHRVVLLVQDGSLDGSHLYQPVIQLLADTGGGTPATPANASSLGIINVPSGTASITNARITDGRVPAHGPRDTLLDMSSNMSMASVAAPDPMLPMRLRFNYTESATDAGGYIPIPNVPSGWTNLLGCIPIAAFRASPQLATAYMIFRQDQTKFQFRNGIDGSNMTNAQVAWFALLIGQ